MNLDNKLLGESSRRRAPLSPATAFASSVFPAPVAEEVAAEVAKDEAAEETAEEEEENPQKKRHSQASELTLRWSVRSFSFAIFRRVWSAAH